MRGHVPDDQLYGYRKLRELRCELEATACYFYHSNEDVWAMLLKARNDIANAMLEMRAVIPPKDAGD